MAAEKLCLSKEGSAYRIVLEGWNVGWVRPVSDGWQAELRERNTRHVSPVQPTAVRAFDHLVKAWRGSRKVSVTYDNVPLSERIGAPLDTNASFEERADELLRVYEELLFLKHGRHQKAAYSRRSREQNGTRLAVERTVMNNETSIALRELLKWGRLDCSYEQLILDFPDLYGPEVIAKAKANLAALGARVMTASPTPTKEPTS